MNTTSKEKLNTNEKEEGQEILGEGCGGLDEG